MQTLVIPSEIVIDFYEHRSVAYTALGFDVKSSLILCAARERSFMTFAPKCGSNTYEISGVPYRCTIPRKDMVDLLLAQNGDLRIAQADFQEAIYDYGEAVSNYDQFHAPPKIEYDSWRILKWIADYPNSRVIHLVHFVLMDEANKYCYAIFGKDIPDYQFVIISSQLRDDFRSIIEQYKKDGVEPNDSIEDDFPMTTNLADMASACVISGIPNTVSTSSTNGIIPNNLTTTGIIGTYHGVSIPLAEIETKTEQTKEKENDTMNIPSMKFDFGPMSSNDTQMSPYGLAIKYKDAWYAYNAATSQTIDVTGMTFDFEGMIYKTPVALSAVQEGDLIIHQGRPVYVIQVNNMASIEVVDLAASEQKTVIPVSNMFGFNFVTKVAPLFNFGTVTPSADNPFGNIVPMMLMSSLFGDKNDSNKSKDNDMFKMMAMMSLMGGNNPFGQMFNFGAPAAGSSKEQ